MQKEWFASWFDSKYYHLLYRNHDEQDAQAAVKSLLKALDLHPESAILDLACGKGRHARLLAESGYYVTGLDISHQSIAFARQFESDRLEFYQHDMRLPFRTNYYDAIVNFFTSFGYFETDADHERTLINVAQQLKPRGLLLIDFFNAEKVKKTIVPKFEKTVEGIEFKIKKRIENNRILKHIAFEDNNKQYEYEERVRLFTLSDFECMADKAHLKIERTFGNYALDIFDVEMSDRLILLMRK
jgi:SAM-dependent methyltransferase